MKWGNQIFNPKICKGKVILVTGSSEGIGRTAALEFARYGANIIINYKHKEDLATKAAREAESFGVDVLCVKADVSQCEEVESLFAKITNKFGRLDILVNNAGVNLDKTVLKMPIEIWDEVIRNNLRSVFNCCKSALPIMINQGHGRIINISSVIGLTGNFGQANYSASKAGIIGFTKSLALEAAKFNIAVNAVAPGFVNVGMTRTIPSERLKAIIDRIPMKRFAEPIEIANVILFLASDAASFITGQVINVNGGFYM